jgi:GxxExxY protein
MLVESEMSDDQMSELIFKDVTFQIIAAVIEVHKILGFGFLENVYEKALLKELTLRGLNAESQREIKVTYKNEEVGSYFADIVVNGEIILELKSVEHLTNIHKAQLLNYLKGTGSRLGFLINFGKEKAEYKRLVL